jgi:hypothetical protein
VKATWVGALSGLLSFLLGVGAAKLTWPAPRPPRTPEELVERLRETGFTPPRLIHAESIPPGGAFLTYNDRPEEEILSLPWRFGHNESLAGGWHGTVHVIKVEDRVGVPTGCVGGIVGDLFLCGDPRLIREIEYRIEHGHGPPDDTPTRGDGKRSGPSLPSPAE